jgi:endo-1,4-beta-xylanase
MNRSLASLTVLVLTLAGCVASGTPQPTLEPAQGPTSPATVELTRPATLFSGPGNLAYDTLAELPAGASLDPVGVYGDFLKVTVSVEGMELTGYVWSEALQMPPVGLPTLQSQDVPWEPLFLPQCVPGSYDPHTDTWTLRTAEGEPYFSLASAVWHLEMPVRVRVGKLEMPAVGAGSIAVLGSPVGGKSRTVWWEGVTALGIESSGGKYVLQVRDGTSEQLSASIPIGYPATEPIQVLFDQPEGKSFSVLNDDGVRLVRVDLTALPGVNLPGGLFPKREFYLSVAVTGASSLVITGLAVEAEPKGVWIEQEGIGPGLVALARERSLLTGTEFSLNRMIDRRYCQAMHRDFGVAIISDFNSTSPAFWLGPGEYDFGRVDRIVDFAKERGWRVVASHLVWGEPGTIPDWLKKVDYTREDYIRMLEEYVRAVVKHYRGRIQVWSIANEAPERIYFMTRYPTSTTNDFWYEKIGPEYIEMAFRWAREEDPGGLLIFNSGQNHPPLTGDRSAIVDQMYTTVKDLLAKGVPIDAIGMQFHLFLPFDTQIAPTKEAIVEIMQRFGVLGVRVYITEMEVDLGSTPGTQSERYEFQARVYRDVLDACLESGVCDGFYVWGVTDSLSWVICPFEYPFCLNEPNGDPLLFDRDLNPKPSYFAVRDALAGTPYVARATAAGSEVELPQASTPTGAPQSTSTLRPEVVLNMYDDFNNPAKDGTYDRSKWRIAGGAPSLQARQENGILSIVNSGSQANGDVTLFARAYDGVVLRSPMFLEGGLALSSESAPGSVSLGLQASLPKGATWFSGCTIERYSSQFRGSCGDFVWPEAEGHRFDTPWQSFDPGSWHVFRIGIEPTTMMISYFVDGAVVGSHVPADAEALKSVRLRFDVSTWKTTVDSPLIGLVDYVSIGPTDE